MQIYLASMTIPQQFLDIIYRLAPKDEFINQAELLAAAAVYTTFPDILVDRSVLH